MLLTRQLPYFERDHCKKFVKSLEEQQVEVVQGDWVHPAGGDKEMMDLLDQLL